MILNRAAVSKSDRHAVALSCVEAGISAARPESVVSTSISLAGSQLRIGDATYNLANYTDVVVVGGGNPAGHLAAAVEDVLGDWITAGIVVTDDTTETTTIEQIQGRHPVPDETGEHGAQRILETVADAGEDTLVLVLVTGGGSALLPAPAGEVSLTALQAVTDLLLRSGASIEEINAVRKHLSALKGGQLARAAAPARVVGLVMSDVVGNRLDVIASGPISPDSSTFEEARSVLSEYDVDPPQSVAKRLAAGSEGVVPETPTHTDPVFDRVSIHVLADGMTSLQAARDAAEKQGFQALILSSRIRGEAQESAKTHVGIAEEAVASGHPISPPTILLSGGETTVTVEGDGTGGPNQEFALSAALELEAESICLAAVDTDGIDGATDVAGAIVTAATAQSATDARMALAGNDAYPFLSSQDALIETGPTGTNVNDLRVIVIPETDGEPEPR